MTTTADSGAPAIGSAYLPVDITPENLFQALGLLRKEAFDEIERLLQFLDDCDGDVDLEPSNGSGQNGGDDREADHEGEPALGSVDSHHSQTRWAGGNSDDREGDGCADDREGDELQHGGDEHDGAEPEAAEPSLGSLDNEIDQERWSAGKSSEITDLEQGAGPSQETVGACRQRRNERRRNVGPPVASQIGAIDVPSRLTAGSWRQINVTATQAKAMRRRGVSGAVLLGQVKE